MFFYSLKKNAKLTGPVSKVILISTM